MGTIVYDQLKNSVLECVVPRACDVYYCSELELGRDGMPGGGHLIVAGTSKRIVSALVLRSLKLADWPLMLWWNYLARGTLVRLGDVQRDRALRGYDAELIGGRLKGRAAYRFYANDIL